MENLWPGVAKYHTVSTQRMGNFLLYCSLSENLLVLCHKILYLYICVHYRADVYVTIALPALCYVHLCYVFVLVCELQL